jgi:predicted RNase H-like HicB family nuclease
MATIELENTAVSPKVTDANWSARKAYRCHICLIREEDGSFSAVVLNLPGAGSCGATYEEALENVREAILGVIESYTEAGEEIPWRDSVSDDIPEGAKRKWILVNA